MCVQNFKLFSPFELSDSNLFEKVLNFLQHVSIDTAFTDSRLTLQMKCRKMLQLAQAFYRFTPSENFPLQTVSWL
jgi:hypothetical protein